MMLMIWERTQVQMAKKNYFFIRIFGYILIGGVFAFLFEEHISNEIIKNTLSTLQNISAAVFTLSGLWIAIIYPEAIKAYTDIKVKLIRGSESVKRIEHLVLSVTTSAFVLMLILFFNLLLPFHPQVTSQSLIDVGINYIFIATFFTMITLQMVTLLSIIINGFKFANDLYYKYIEQEIDDDL